MKNSNNIEVKSFFVSALVVGVHEVKVNIWWAGHHGVTHYEVDHNDE